jgi:hypothetical protein
MLARGALRSAEEVEQARRTRQEKVSLVLGRAVQKIIRSTRIVVAARLRIAASKRAREKSTATRADCRRAASVA